MNVPALERGLQRYGFKTRDFNTFKDYDTVDLLHEDNIVMVDYGYYTIMVGYRSETDDCVITEVSTTHEECSERSFIFNDEDDILSVCVYLTAEAKLRSRLESLYDAS